MVRCCYLHFAGSNPRQGDDGVVVIRQSGHATEQDAGIEWVVYRLGPEDLVRPVSSNTSTSGVPVSGPLWQWPVACGPAAVVQAFQSRLATNGNELNRERVSAGCH